MITIMGLVHGNDYRTWGLYTNYTICMLLTLLHDVCTFLHNFKLRAWYSTMPNRYCEHEVILYANFRWLLGFSDIICSYLFLRISVEIAF